MKNSPKKLLVTLALAATLVRCEPCVATMGFFGQIVATLAISVGLDTGTLVGDLLADATAAYRSRTLIVD